jgi:hypothetical protein
MGILDPSAPDVDLRGHSNFSGGGGGGGEISGGPLADWETLGRTANIRVLDFNKNFSIRFQQQYTLWHGSWEVYVGRFAGPQRDGIFLFDRAVGEGRIMDFDSHMVIFDYQELHNLDGNWLVYSGDFIGSGRAQLLLYDPSSGTAQIMLFARNLALTNQKLYSDWATNQVLYVGHFGTNALNVMLYDPEVQQSTFLAFNKALEVVRQSVVQSWDQHLEILVGAFLDRVRCLASHSCSTGDDILVLNRQTGQIQQYVFSFGDQFHQFDNRSTSFERKGIASAQPRVNSADTTTFSLLATLKTSVRDEELY